MSTGPNLLNEVTYQTPVLASPKSIGQRCNETLALVALIVPAACGVAAGPAFTTSFLQHVAKNAPAGKSSCYVSAIQRRWVSQAKVREDADKIRMSRGETDVVNFAIKQLSTECADASNVRGQIAEKSPSSCR